MAAATGSIEGRRFVTMRFKRIKTWSHVYHVRRHNTREMECRHVEKDAPPPHLIVGTPDVGGAIRTVLDRYGVKHKAGEVLALEYVVSTSREVFEGLEENTHTNRLGAFVVYTLRAFLDRFKVDGQIVSVALHRDERTPHLHVVVVPLICEPDNRRRDKTPIYRLSAKRVIGGRGDMSREQTRFASYFEEMGLERGKERSGARHVSNREHEAMLEEARQAAMAEREGLAVERQQLAGVALEVAAERNELAAERAKVDRERHDVETERARQREEGERLAAERGKLTEKLAEAEALKSRAIKRTMALRELLLAGEKLRSYVLSMPSERRTPAVQKAYVATQRFANAAGKAVEDDAWLSAALSYRARGGAGASR